jgi:hypothetical protein
VRELGLSDLGSSCFWTGLGINLEAAWHRERDQPEGLAWASHLYCVAWSKSLRLAEPALPPSWDRWRER